MTSREVTKLIAADNMGLLPDPWLQTATLCQVLAAVNGNDCKPDDFLYKRRAPKTAAEIKAGLMAGFEQRKREHEERQTWRR